MESPAARSTTLAARWKGLSSVNRRRIILGSLVAVSLAARDVLLLAVASGMFALSEVGAAPVRRASLA